MNPDEFFSLPFLDQVAFPILLSVFFLLLVMESVFALRQRYHNRWKRWVTNGSIAAVGLPAARLVLLPATVYAAYWSAREGFGLLNWVSIPAWAGWVLAFLLLDYFIYIWHRLNHIVPLLWRFHQVHHADLDMDISTAIRFHVGELLLSVPFRVAVVLLTGVTPLMVLVYEIVFEAATLFHHSNWRLPLKIERTLGKFIITPRIHGIHHSVVQRETNSNYSTVFSFWDRLHRSHNFYVPQNAISIGLPGIREEHENKLGPLLRLPFVKIKKWELPNGEIPDRPFTADRTELPK